jgi:hypothetical protein
VPDQSEPMPQLLQCECGVVVRVYGHPIKGVDPHSARACTACGDYVIGTCPCTTDTTGDHS